MNQKKQQEQKNQKWKSLFEVPSKSKLESTFLGPFESRDYQKILFKNSDESNDESKKVNIYLCGPTVYDDLHLGNMRGAIFFDMFVRIARLVGYKVDYVQNITDIDDKIIAKAQLEGVDERVIGKRYFERYRELYREFDLKEPDEFMHVSDYMEKAIIPFIYKLEKTKRLLLNKKFFGLKKIEESQKDKEWIDTFPYTELTFNVYKLGYQSLLFRNSKKFESKIIAQERSIPTNVNIIDPFDDKNFTIWKMHANAEGKKWLLELKSDKWKQKKHWGRPGWHTECCALIDYRFGINLTLHGGGLDLKDIHHYNEYMQFKAIHNTPLTQDWIRHGLVYFKDQKVSKSDPEIAKKFLAKNFIEKHGSNTTKLIFLTKHYDKNLNLNEEVFLDCHRLETNLHQTLKFLKFIAYQLKFELPYVNKKNMNEEKIKDIFHEYNEKPGVISITDFINFWNQNNSYLLYFLRNRNDKALLLKRNTFWSDSETFKFEENLSYSGQTWIEFLFENKFLEQTTNKTDKLFSVSKKFDEISSDFSQRIEGMFVNIVFFSYLVGLQYDFSEYSSDDQKQIDEWIWAWKKKDFKQSDKLREELMKRNIF